jgi:CRISPR-associated protein Cas6
MEVPMADIQTVDLIFSVGGDKLPRDHSYALFGALCRLQPAFHKPRHPVGIFPINGRAVEGRRLELTEKSRLRVRLPAGRLHEANVLSQAELELDGSKVQLGLPRAEPAPPAAALFSPWVTYRDADGEGAFLERLHEELSRGDLLARCSLGKARSFPETAPTRAVRSIKGARIVGYPVLLSDLSPQHSARLCALGLGGRRHFGGGLFLPARTQ